MEKARESEPYFVYEHINGNIPALLKKSDITAFDCTTNIMVIGNSGGYIYILQPDGVAMAAVCAAAHTRNVAYPVSHLRLSPVGDYFVSCCGPNIIICPLYEHQKNIRHFQTKSLAICAATHPQTETIRSLEDKYSDYLSSDKPYPIVLPDPQSEDATREIYVGTSDGSVQRILPLQKLSKRNPEVVFSGGDEGSILAIEWSGTTVVWATTMGVHFYSTEKKERFSFIDRPAVSGKYLTAADYSVSISFIDSNLVAISWAGTVQYARIHDPKDIERSKLAKRALREGQLKVDLPFVEIEGSLYVCGGTNSDVKRFRKDEEDREELEEKERKEREEQRRRERMWEEEMDAEDKERRKKRQKERHKREKERKEKEKKRGRPESEKEKALREAREQVEAEEIAKEEEESNQRREERQMDAEDKERRKKRQKERHKREKERKEKEKKRGRPESEKEKALREAREQVEAEEIAKEEEESNQRREERRKLFREEQEKAQLASMRRAPIPPVTPLPRFCCGVARARILTNKRGHGYSRSGEMSSTRRMLSTNAYVGADELVVMLTIPSVSKHMIESKSEKAWLSPEELQKITSELSDPFFLPHVTLSTRDYACVCEDAIPFDMNRICTKVRERVEKWGGVGREREVVNQSLASASSSSTPGSEEPENPSMRRQAGLGVGIGGEYEGIVDESATRSGRSPSQVARPHDKTWWKKSEQQLTDSSSLNPSSPHEAESHFDPPQYSSSAGPTLSLDDVSDVVGACLTHSFQLAAPRGAGQFRGSIFYIVHSRGILRLRRRTVSDHISYLLRCGQCEKALVFASKQQVGDDNDGIERAYAGCGISNIDVKRIAGVVIGHLLKEETVYSLEKAAEIASVYFTSAEDDDMQWNKWCYIFCSLSFASYLAPVIPLGEFDREGGVHCRLTPKIYKCMYVSLLAESHEALNTFVQRLHINMYHVVDRGSRFFIDSSPLFDPMPLIYAIKGRLLLFQYDTYLIQALCRLYTMIKRPDLALSVMMHHPELIARTEKEGKKVLFKHINTYHLFDTIVKNNLLTRLVENDAAKAVDLLARNIRSVSVSVIIEQLSQADCKANLISILDKIGKQDIQSIKGHQDTMVRLYAEVPKKRKNLPLFIESVASEAKRGAMALNMRQAAAVCQSYGIWDAEIEALKHLDNVNKHHLIVEILVKKKEGTNNLHSAINYIATYGGNDSSLWDCLIDCACCNERHIPKLLRVIGNYTDPLRMVRRIPSHIHIRGLGEHITCMLVAARSSLRIRETCSKLLGSDSVIAGQKLHERRKRGVLMKPDSRCVFCNEPLASGDTSQGHVVFFCGHCAHWACLPVGEEMACRICGVREIK
ncbi:Vacuolar protein sorting-associated protein Vps41/Vps8 like protein [Aduncisulcus paluster]|uniref:Vacuolar protein sorting-associated protein Vps41/Vps8 like protein n=1 Tax=Aduncisulcus paluster TaxID=2918883 RepID=A0ABQ5K3I8_9EUKA|nr:Vacuolar protein sorting-associated protein Vps41/Vps8 like protein [Aduncisulcus paluster]